jgi:signal transduction histidine kinase
VVVLDRDRRLIDANAQAQRLLGLDDTSIGVPVADLPTAAFLASVDQTGPVEAAGEHLVRVGERSLSVRIKKTGRAGFRSASYVATVDDVTETIRMQEALEQVRARMISQDRLASLGLIAAGVAHEINNPLGYVWSDVRSLRSTVEGWSEGGTPDLAVVSAILASCEEGLGRISSVVQQLLSYARHGVEGQDAAEPFDLNAGIRSTLVLCRSEYKNAARIVLHLGDVPPLQARRNEINQVVLNIVTNAARAISRGRGGGTRLGTIRITTGHEDGEAYCLIENDGPPIPADVAGRIFEPFFSTAGPGEGMGLGLSVSKEIVEKRHHGGLRLISTDPVAFRVSLPTGERAATP